MLLNAQGKALESRDLAEQALIILAEEETQVRGLIYIELAAAYQQTYDYGRAAEACELIIQQGRLAGDFASELFGLSYLGRMFLYQGMLRSTDEIASEALQRLKQTGSFSPFSATLYGELAQVYYYWHELEKARECFLRSVELSTLGGFSDAEIYHSVFLSRLFQMEGDLQASMREMEKALERMQTAAPALVNEEVISQQVSINLALDRLAAAQSALKPYGFAFEDRFSAPGLAMDADVPLADVRIPYPVGLLYDSALRILLYRAAVRHEMKELRYGIELAGLVIEGSLRCRHLPIVLKTLLLRGQMQAALGDERAGLADVAKALELGEPEGFISTFIEEGLPIKEALTTLLKRNMAGSASAGYIRDILAAFPKTLSKQEAVTSHKPARSDELSTDKSSALFEPLTARELEVLRLIAAGDSNRAIAEKLVITVSAVKKHTANIYGKLNVDSRTQAVALAHQLGLLPQDG
jgi:LuxR family maltose regulon positive regulatory protein